MRQLCILSLFLPILLFAQGKNPWFVEFQIGIANIDYGTKQIATTTGANIGKHLRLNNHVKLSAGLESQRIFSPANIQSEAYFTQAHFLSIPMDVKFFMKNDQSDHNLFVGVGINNQYNIHMKSEAKDLSTIRSNDNGFNFGYHFRMGYLAKLTNALRFSIGCKMAADGFQSGYKKGQVLKITEQNTFGLALYGLF